MERVGMARDLAQDVLVDGNGFRQPPFVLELGRPAQAGEVGVLGRGAHGGEQEGSGPYNHGPAALFRFRARRRSGGLPSCRARVDVLRPPGAAPERPAD